jgi:hypothetical protein
MFVVAWGSARSAPGEGYLKETMRRRVVEQSRLGRNAAGRKIAYKQSPWGLLRVAIFRTMPSGIWLPLEAARES